MLDKKITFLDKEYTKLDLEKLEVEQLLELRNLIAANLGVSSIKGFKDKEQAVEGTWKALERFEQAVQNEESGGEPIVIEEEPKKRRRSRTPSEPRGVARSAVAKDVKRPTRKMFSTLRKVGEHDGTQGRYMRWNNYYDGMTLVDVIETEGCEPWDVYNWQRHRIMEVVEPTDEQYRERRAAWYAKQGREDPEILKAREKEERAREEAAAQAQETQ